MIRTGFAKGIGIVCLWLLATAGMADTLRYQIYVAVFENRNTAGTESLLPEKNGLQLPAHWQELGEPGESTDLSIHGDFTRLPISDKAFDKVVRNLRASDDYRLLTVAHWIQPVTNPEEAVAVRITGGTPQGSYHPLDGSLTVSIGRDLVLETDLWLGEYAPVPGSAVPATPSLDINTIDYDEQPSPLSAGEFTPTRLLRIRHTRHMEAGKLHYLDHPALGVLVKVVAIHPAAARTHKTPGRQVRNPEAGD